MTRISAIATAGAMTFVLGLPANTAAQQPDTHDRTIMTFSAPVELPGMRLEAGTYVFRLAVTASRNVIQVLSHNEMEMLGQWLFIPAERRDVTSETVVTFRETSAGSTPAVQYWFYPGESIGKEFIYPKDQAMRIARRTGATVQTEDGPVTADARALVVLHVTVLDERSDAVPDLPQRAFRVLEDDEPQEITFFSSADVPVAVGLILDGSASMITRHGLVFAGGEAFIRASHPEDELFTVSFNERVRFGLPPTTVPFTSHPTLLRAALWQYRPNGRTALHDAVVAAVDHLDRATHQKRVLVVLSDGKDNASRHTREEMLDRVRRSNALVYTVSNATRRNGLEADPRVLRRLAEASGSVAYFPDSDEEVVESFDEIAGNVRRGYLIGYVPRNAAHDGGFRRVTVTVRAPGRTRLTVRSREGYEAQPH